jgi:hypothetical protein
MDEIPLAGTASGAGLVARVIGRGRSARGGSGAKLLVSAGALLIDGHPDLGGKLEIPLGSVKRVVVDDGAGWAYTTSICRFPIFDRRPDGSGTGALVGPLWSTSPSLMPDGCPVIALGPVPAEVPNVALFFEPCISTVIDGRAPRQGGGTVAAMFLRAEDPDSATDLLSARLPTGPLGLDLLEYLKRPNLQLPEAADGEASAASA